MLYEELSGKVLKAYFNVLRNLGTGYLESVYERALCIELDELGVPYVRQKHLSVIYKGQNIGEFVADIVVDDKIVLELKAVSKLVPAHSAQLINYLTITGCKNRIATELRRRPRLQARLPKKSLSPIARC